MFYGDRLFAFRDVEFEIFLVTQEEGDTCFRDFGFDEFTGDIEEAVEVVGTDNRLIEVCREIYCFEPFDKFSLRGNEVIAEYIYFSTLLFARFVYLAYKQSQFFISFSVLHVGLFFKIISLFSCFLTSRSAQGKGGFKCEEVFSQVVVGSPINNDFISFEGIKRRAKTGTGRDRSCFLFVFSDLPISCFQWLSDCLFGVVFYLVGNSVEVVFYFGVF